MKSINAETAVSAQRLTFLPDRFFRSCGTTQRFSIPQSAAPRTNPG